MFLTHLFKGVKSLTNLITTIKIIFQYLILLSILFFSFSQAGYAYENEFNAHAQIFVSNMTIEEEDPDVKENDYSFYLIGGAGQVPFQQINQLKYGLEVGMLFSMDNDTRLVEASGGSGGGSVTVQVKNKMFLFDYFFGGYASYTLADRLRLYIGAGPLLIYGRRESDPEDNNEEILLPEVESQLSAGFYGRTGAEIRISKDFMLGAGVRYITSGLEFTGQAGKVKVEGPQYYVNFSYDI